MRKDDPLETELGLALTDRLGLIPATTLRDYETETVGGKVLVTMHTIVPIPLDEYQDLCRAAAIRAGVL